MEGIALIVFVVIHFLIHAVGEILLPADRDVNGTARVRIRLQTLGQHLDDVSLWNCRRVARAAGRFGHDVSDVSPRFRHVDESLRVIQSVFNYGAVLKSCLNQTNTVYILTMIL